MAKIIEKIETTHFELKNPLEQIVLGDIIKDKWGDKLVIDIEDNKIKTLRWYFDSLRSKIALETYEVIDAENKRLLVYNDYQRPEPGSEDYNRLIKLLEASGVKERN